PHEVADQAVARFTREKKVDLLVTGFSGVQGLKKLVSCDVSERIVARAGCSMITLKRTDFVPQISVVEPVRARPPVYRPQRMGVTSGTLSTRMR
ncbi:MAG: universal stress protein, partial [Rhodospirillales bacterium]|nr:universal stress protein [Rhodospirillales bacterium]